MYCINYFAIAVIKTACSRQLRERRNYLELMVTERWVHCHHSGECGSKQAQWPEHSHPKPPAGSRECELGMECGFWNLKASPQWQISSSKVTPPELTQTALPAGDQLFKCSVQWGDMFLQTITYGGFSQSSEDSSLLYDTNSIVPVWVWNGT